MVIKEGRKLCNQVSPGLKNQKNVSWKSILSESYYLRPNVEVSEVVSSLTRIVEGNWLNFVQEKQHTENRKKKKEI